MSLLIDTSALIAVRNADDNNHARALNTMTRAIKGEFGKLFLSERAWELYLQYEDKNFSFTDCTNIAFMERQDVDTLFTYEQEKEIIFFGKQNRSQYRIIIINI